MRNLGQLCSLTLSIYALWIQVILPRLQHSWTEEQLSDISNLGYTCQQAEEALAQGMEKLQETLDKATEAGDKGFQVTCVSQKLCFLKQVMHT